MIHKDATIKCPKCDGVGFLSITSKNPCPKCMGIGIISEEDV